MRRSNKLILILVVLVLTAWALRDGLKLDTGSFLPAGDERDSLINVAGRTVQERIKVPEGFERVPGLYAGPGYSHSQKSGEQRRKPLVFHQLRGKTPNSGVRIQP